MKLIRLKLENFMGVKSFDFAPMGRSVTVLGANDTGKSTLETAYWWLLTGKNADQSTDFDVYPYEAAEGVEASVTGEFENGDETFSLMRTYKREFTRRKGDAESTFKGNKTAYFINGVPETQTKFKAFVAEHIAPEDKLLALGKLHYFAMSMKWDARRALLLDVFAPHLSDADIIKAHEELAPLSGWSGAMTTVEDMTRQAKAKRREINAELNEIPARIDEAERFVQLQAADIEDKINERFKRVRWVMFDRQVNGGIAPCCRATVQSEKADVYTAYESNTNTARQYNAGLDIIESLSDAMNLHLPVWVDNAESCTHLAGIQNQMLRLCVAEEYKEIKLEEKV